MTDTALITAKTAEGHTIEVDFINSTIRHTANDPGSQAEAETELFTGVEPFLTGKVPTEPVLWCNGEPIGFDPVLSDQFDLDKDINLLLEPADGIGEYEFLPWHFTKVLEVKVSEGDVSVTFAPDDPTLTAMHGVLSEIDIDSLKFGEAMNIARSFGDLTIAFEDRDCLPVGLAGTAKALVDELDTLDGPTRGELKVRGIAELIEEQYPAGPSADAIEAELLNFVDHASPEEHGYHTSDVFPGLSIGVTEDGKAEVFFVVGSFTEDDFQTEG